MTAKLEPRRVDSFRKQLLRWATTHHRPLPWKGEKNPYFIWLSEIILQQTRVAQGLPYFRRFKTLFPDVYALANASQDEVYKAWQGLGYYARARNLHASAKKIAYELNGVFPDTYDGLLSLKGVGPYTAAAIASFAFDLPYAVLDGNVFRVLARYFGLDTPIDSTAGKKQFAQLAQACLAPHESAKYNQAIMDFGATQCTPAAPACEQCTLQAGCQAYQTGTVDLLPIKQKKQKKRTRYFQYIVLETAADETLIVKRTEKDIWQGLYNFPLLETNVPPENRVSFTNSSKWKHFFGPYEWTLLRVSPPAKQILSHQVIYATFWHVQVKDIAPFTEKNGRQLPKKELSSYAFPRIIDLYLREKSLTLELF